MTHPTVVRLVEGRFAADQILRAARPHRCAANLQGSAVMWCGTCGRTIPAADIDHEYHPPGGAR